MKKFTSSTTSVEIVDEIERCYDKSAFNIRRCFDAFTNDGSPPTIEERLSHAFCYPKLTIDYRPKGAIPPVSRAYGKFNSAGSFATDITRPKLFRTYLTEQIDLLRSTYDCSISVTQSQTEIPYPYVIDSVPGLDIDRFPPSDLAVHFPFPNLAAIDDSIADGNNRRGKQTASIWEAQNSIETELPLSLFSALRTDYSLQRLAHYTGTKAEEFQSFILFTNYQRYMDEFVDLAFERIALGERFVELSGPGGVVGHPDIAGSADNMKAASRSKFQMPAFHMKTTDGNGITLINIGVGPSNAKTITDHLAVLRPHCWVMIGHCGGLRQSQRLGDYVLAHAYLRYDGVLDTVLAPEIPIPPIAEIQVALFDAAARVTGEKGHVLKERLRTGTVVTNDDRNWELRYRAEAHRIDQSRAIAVDMESATLAANGYRFRVPYGTLLCVSDKPLHGEIKLPGSANRFYERAISEHMRIGIEAMDLLWAQGTDALHSRKLRSFEEPPFR